MFSSNKKDGQNPRLPGRRVFLIASGIGAAGIVLSYFHRGAPVHVEAAATELPKMVKIVEFTDAGQRKDTVTVARIVKTEEEWRKQLTPDCFEVTSPLRDRACLHP
jgi:hypothetical protein